MMPKPVRCEPGSSPSTRQSHARRSADRRVDARRRCAVGRRARTCSNIAPWALPSGALAVAGHTLNDSRNTPAPTAWKPPPSAPPEIAARLDAARRVLAELGVEPTRARGGAARRPPRWARSRRMPTWRWRPPALGAPARGSAASRRARGARSANRSLRLAEQLEHLGVLRLPADWSASQGLDAQQAETLRKMLLAVAADPRLVVARLAEQLVRAAPRARLRGSSEQQRLALETRAMLAPLANRLGVWNLKWELEDLAFRYLEPDDYHRIARALAERRVDRERYIEAMCAQLRQRTRAAGVAPVAVYGRPKHIYSIWRKMQRKHVAVRAAVRRARGAHRGRDRSRIATRRSGVVHGLWHYIPGEFDDYIATPKDNDYRSIHTAVIGPEDKSLEMQIRSREMHEHAELGVAAHWRYKEGGARDAGYERKIEWVRRVLDPAQSR